MAWSWRRLNEKPPLDPAFIWAAGSRGFDPLDEQGGRAPDDVADFRRRLALLCSSLREEAGLNALGHAMAYGQLKGAVRTRHALGRLWRTQPDLAQTATAAPIIVVGQMRSGTTRIHRLLAADPRHAGTRLCNSLEPAPTRPDLRPLRCAAKLALARRINPWLDVLHPVGATWVDEELGWLGASLSHGLYEAQYRIPAYVGFSELADQAAVYGELGRIARTDAAVMRNAARPRVLKCPQYAEDLSDLLAQFPDARIVVARRDAGVVLASTVSVIASHMAYQSDRVSLAEIEAEWRRKLTLREQRLQAALAGFAGPVAEVRFDELNADWRGALAAVYAALGIELTPAAFAAIAREQAASQRSAHRSHAGAYRRFAQAQPLIGQ